MEDEGRRAGTAKVDVPAEPCPSEQGKTFYGVEDVPPVHLCFLFGLQQAILCLGSTLSIPFIISGMICAEDESDVRAKLLSITMFMCGLATVLQSTFGVRLGIVQGGSHTFIAPIVAMMSLSKWSCPHPSGEVSVNETSFAGDKDEAWQLRMREIQGNLILASLTQVILGCTGVMGFFLRFIGPLTIAPTISLIGLSLTGVASAFNTVHWGIASLTFSLIAIFSLFLARIQVPLPSFSMKRKFHMTRFPVFQLLPVIISICIGWFVCYILTITDTFPNDRNAQSYYARTDSRLDVMSGMPWFYIPYPFIFGTPTVSAAGYVGMLAATLSSVVESIGDYFAAAKISHGTPPPPHAINRGLAMEGFCSILSGLVGAGHATTSYSSNIGAIGITKVASRRVFQVAGIILVVGGVVGKIGAVLTLIPDPVIGGILTVVFGMVTMVGISTLQYTDMSSTRNLTIMAIAIILGLMVPQWITQNPNAIQTGHSEFDQVLNVLLGTAMFVGGFLGCLLDNLVPGTSEERGIKKWRESMYDSNGKVIESNVQYDIPYVTKYIRKVECFSFIPICPTFDGMSDNMSCRKRRPRDFDMNLGDKHPNENNEQNDTKL
ncbi:solute carrier family 23 member 2-like [Pecten maximus]|uniref:solute carrier family 23 member 2-like n=1 Tax=Pecten maximus TaxID=6579 RepID=UPI001458D48A|nr:solute carrier family 23 member 2-like [Pecten maximus]XP_033756972.1 solute carrier family 23 member 2-like [Pecten maximus]